MSFWTASNLIKGSFYLSAVHKAMTGSVKPPAHSQSQKTFIRISNGRKRIFLHVFSPLTQSKNKDISQQSRQLPVREQSVYPLPWELKCAFPLLLC